MCYSASASFASSLALTLMSSILVARSPAHRFFPIVLAPFFFALQQFAEGLVWLNYYPTVAKDIYLFFAYIFWPIYVPIAFLVLEESPKRKLLLMFCLGAGFIVALNLGSQIGTINPKFVGNSIHYSYVYPDWFTIALSYVIAVVGPMFITSYRPFWIFGFFGILSAGLIAYFDLVHFVSLWCFLAALASLALFFLAIPKGPLK